MKALPVWRKNLFTVGWVLLCVNGAVFPVASFRSPYLRAAHSYIELGAWMFGGMSMALISLGLILFGTGLKRGILILCVLAEIYLWFSYVALEVQLS